MLDPDSPTNLVERHRQGDQKASAELFTRFAAQLAHLAEQHLSRKLAGRVEGEDVVQSAFRTFFRRATAGEFRIDNSDQLWGLLVTITVRKARAQGRRHTAAVRDVSAESPAAAGDATLGLADHEPGPEEAVILMDEIESLLKNLPLLYSQILELRLQGHSATDVAGQLGVSRRTVYRALELLGQRLIRVESEMLR